MIKIVLITIIVFTFLFKVIVNRLSFSKQDEQTLPIIQSNFDSDIINKTKAYNKNINNLNLFYWAIEFLIIIIFFILDIPTHLYDIVYNSWNSAFPTNILVAILVGTPFILIRVIKDYILTDKIDNKYGLTRLTRWKLILKLIAELILLYSLVILIVCIFGTDNVSIKIAAFFTLFILIFVYKYLVLKGDPIEDGELKECLLDFANKHNVKIKGVYVKKASKTTTRSNALVHGSGRKKKILIYDNLIKSCSKKEILAVFAHEVGHIKHKHLLKQTILYLLVFVIFAYFLVLVVQRDLIANNGALSNLNPVYLMFLLYSIRLSVLLLINTIKNLLSRRMEYSADKFSVLNTSEKDMFNALKRIAKTNLSNLNLHPIYEFINYAHPSLPKRLRKITELNDTNISK